MKLKKHTERDLNFLSYNLYTYRYVPEYAPLMLHDLDIIVLYLSLLSYEMREETFYLYQFNTN